MWKCNRIFVLLLLAIFLLSLPVAAADGLDIAKECTLTIDTIPAGSVTVFRVAEAAAQDGGYSYRYIDAFAAYNGVSRYALTQENFDSDSLAAPLWDFALEHAEMATYTIEDGKVEISGLSVGVYLIGQKEAQVAEGYYAINPFLVTLPGKMDGEWVYHVDAHTKVQTSTTPSTPPESPPPSTSTPPSPPGTSTPPSPPNPTTELPDTGQTNWPVPVLAIGGIVIFMLGWGIRFSGRKSGHEK